MNTGFTNAKSNIDSRTGWKDVKVAMLVRSFSSLGGLELYAYKLIQELLSLGLHITVICEECQTDLKHQNLKVVQISPSHKNANKVAKIEHYIKEFSAAIQKHGPFDIVHSQHLGAHNVDVVTFHNHTVTRLNECGTSFESILNKLKLLLRPDYIMRDEIDAMLVKEAQVLIFPSRICKQDFVERFQFHKKQNMAALTVAYPGWQLASGTHAAENNSAQYLGNGSVAKEKTIIFVGRGYRKKGLDVLLSACLLLKQQKYNFKLLIAGLKEKPLDKWQLSTFGLTENVKYLGFVNDMEKVYQSGSIIALPSRIEPFGMAALQAMSYGLVPVVSKVSGVAEILQNDIDAQIIENHLDSKELAKHLATLLDDTDKLKRMSEAAKDKAQSVSWQSTVEATLNAYQQVFQKQYVI